MTYRQLQRPIHIPAHVYGVFEGIAKKLGIMAAIGKHDGNPSVAALLGKMAARGDALERWMQYQYPEMDK